MSQNPLTYTSGTQFSKTPSLKPALAAALASLEVQLDRELARYRRTRSYRTPGTTGANTQLQYLTPATVDIYENISQPVVEENQPSIDTSQTRMGHSLAVHNAGQNQYQIASQEIPRTEPNPASSAADVTASSLPLPPPPPPQIPKFDQSNTEGTPTSTSTNPTKTISIVPSTAITDGSKPNPETTDNQPDDYLESSEALLRSLTQEAPVQQKRPTRNDSLLSPLGIGSMLLLLVASLIFGYQVLKFGEYGSSKGNNSTAENSQTSTNTTAKDVAEPLQTPIPKYPNLAKDQFPEVNNPNDVVGLKPQAKVTPTIAPPAPVPNPVVINPSQQLPVNPTPAATITPSIAVTPTPEIPLSEIKLSADGFYHVVIDNNSEDAFATARKAVPDAYLSPDKKLVYLGAIKNKEKAQELLAEIKAKGINARIRQP
jgi:hypothetical protein